MFGGLRKKLNEVWSGADFWDKKENTQQRQQFAQTRTQPQPKPAPARTISQPRQAAPSVSQRVSQSYGTGFSRLGNQLRDFVDPNTQADKIRRFATTGLEEDYQQEQTRKTQAAMNSNAKRNGLNEVASGGLAGVTDFFGKGVGSLAQVQGRVGKAVNSIDNPVLRTGAKLVAAPNTLFTGEKQSDRMLKTGQSMNQFVENKKQQSSIGQRKDDNRLLYGGGQVVTQLPAQIATGGIGLVNTGAQTAAEESNRAQQMGRTNNQALGIGLLQGGVSAVSEKLGVDKFLPGNAVTGRLTTKLVKRAATEGAQEAQQQFTQNLIANKTYNPNQSLKEGVAESAVLGAVAGGAMSPISDVGTRPKPTTGLVKQNPTPSTQTARPNEYNVLSDYQDVLLGNVKNPAVINQTIQDARLAGERLGVDVTSGTPFDISQRINAVLSQQPQVQQVPDPVVTNMPVNQMTDPQSMRARIRAAKERVFTPLNEGGYIAGPLALDFSKQQKAGRVFDGVDGKPRFEVDDSGAKIKNPNGKMLGEILDHPELFKNYPELQNMTVRVDPNLRGNGEFQPWDNSITVKSASDLGTLLHETQHGIQTKEGFAKGANDSIGARKQTELARNKELVKNSQEYRLWKEKRDKVLADKSLTPEQRNNTVMQMEQNLPNAVKTYRNIIDEELRLKLDGNKGYFNSAGEAEARAVQARMNMPMSERYVKPQVDPGKAPEKWQGLIKDSREFTNPDDFVKSKQMDYHGTEQSFKRFSNSAIGSRGEPGFAGKGFYFTNRKNYAREYGKNVMEAHLNIKNPYVLDNAPGGFGVPYSPELIKERLKLPSDATPADITKKLKDMGHDGVVVNVIDSTGRKKNGFEKMVIDAEDIWNPETLRALHEKTRPRSTFYDSLDVPKEDLIVRNGDGKAMSIDKDPLESLKQEAKKYKSAEEFVYEKGLEHPEYRRRVAENEKYINETLKPARAEANRASKAMREMERKYIGKKNLKLSEAEKRKIDAEYNRLGETVRKAQELEDNLPYNYPDEGISREKDLTDLYNQATAKPKAQKETTVPKGEKKSQFEQSLEQAGIKPLQNTQQSQLQTPVQQQARTKSGVASQIAPGSLPETQAGTRTAQAQAQSVESLSNPSNGTISQPKVIDPMQTVWNSNPFSTNATQPSVDKLDDYYNTPRANTPNKMSKAEWESLYNSVPVGTEAKIKVAQPNTERNIPVRLMTREGDVVTATNINPDIKKGEKRYAIDEEGKMIEDKTGAYSIFTNEDGRVTAFRIGKKMFNSSELGDLSDVNDYGSSLATMRRNIERGFGKETGKKVNEFLVDHQQHQATKLIERQVQLKNGMEQVAKYLGISFGVGRRKAKRVSADIQNFGEGKISQSDLVQKYGKEYANKIENADKWFRNNYDSLLTEMNNTLTAYGYEPVPRRKNYYTHFQEPSLWKNFGLKMQEIRSLTSPTLQDSTTTSPRGSISNDLAGQSEFTLPNKKFNKYALRRKGDKATPDAFTAFEKYLTPTLNNIYMTPSITRARVLTKAIAKDADVMGKDANKIIIQTREWANRLAGKTNRLDRPIVDSNWGNKAIKISQWAQRRVGANTIVGNLSTAVMQPVLLTQTAGVSGYKNTLVAALQEASSAHGPNAPIRKSEFMRRRYADTSSVTDTKTRRAAEIANTPLKVIEETAVRISWNAAHNDAISKGLTGDAAIKYADVQTEKTVSGRSIGERPEMFESKAAGLATMYQLEVNNYWQQMGKEMTKEQAAKSMVAAYGFNLVLQSLTGRDAGFNPIDAIIDSIGIGAGDDEDAKKKATRIAQRVAGEFADNLPFTGTVGGMIGNDNYKKLFGRESDSGRFGVGNAMQTLYNNPEMIVSPFGSNQVKKTIGGARALFDGAVTDKNGKVKAEVDGSPFDIARGTAFGKSAIPSVKKYYESIGRPSTAGGAAGSSGGSTVDDILEAQFSTKEQRAWLKLSATEKKEEAKQDPEKAKWLAQYEATKRVNKAAPELPDGMSPESAKVLEWHGKRTPQQREKLAYSQNDYDYKLAKAKYEKDTLEGTISRAEQINRQQSLKKAEVGAKFTKDTRESYNSLSKAELETLAANDENGKKIWEDAVAYGDALVDAGIIKKNKLRTAAKGSGGRKKGSKKGKGKGGKKASKYDYTKNLFGDTGSESSSTTKALRAILEKAMKNKA